MYLGIIGGSGLYAIEGFELEERREVETPFGKPSSPLMIGKLSGVPVVFLARHGEGHVLNPTELNFRANIFALKSVGVKAIFAVGAVGSLKDEIEPGHMVIIDQFFDLTKGRKCTFFEDGIAAHVSLAKPVSQYLRGLLLESCRELDVPCHDGGVYVNMEGPQFSTVPESHFYRMIGGSVIGMTNLQEAKLAREAEIDYATMALSTDYDCWHPEHENVTGEQIMSVFKANIENAQRILKTVVTKFDFNKKLEAEGALANAIFTHRDKVSPQVIERLGPIVEKYFKN